MQLLSYFDKREVLQQEYSQPPILPSSHFPWVVNLYCYVFNEFLRSLVRYKNIHGQLFSSIVLHGLIVGFMGLRYENMVSSWVSLDVLGVTV